MPRGETRRSGTEGRIVMEDAAEIEHLRAALDALDRLEEIVWDGCYSDRADTLINEIRSLFERDLSNLERKALRKMQQQTESRQS